MITRRNNYTKQLPSRDARKLYIFCEGEGTEPAYFSFFKGLSTNLEIITIPPEHGTDPVKLKDLASEKLKVEGAKYIMDYSLADSVWFVIDTDSWKKEGKIDVLRNYCSDCNEEFQQKYTEIKPYSAWNVVQSNPCFEIWLYYHFYEQKPNADEVELFPSFKAFTNDRIHGGFDFQRDPARIKEAVKNSRENDTSEEDGSPALFSTEVYELAELILQFVAEHVDRLSRKME